MAGTKQSITWGSFINALGVLIALFGAVVAYQAQLAADRSADAADLSADIARRALDVDRAVAKVDVDPDIKLDYMAGALALTNAGRTDAVDVMVNITVWSVRDNGNLGGGVSGEPDLAWRIPRIERARTVQIPVSVRSIEMHNSGFPPSRRAVVITASYFRETDAAYYEGRVALYFKDDSLVSLGSVSSDPDYFLIVQATSPDQIKNAVPAMPQHQNMVPIVRRSIEIK